MLKLMRLLTLAGAILGTVVFLIFSSGFPGGDGMFVFWAISPLPVAYGLLRLAARTPLAEKIAVTGLALALVLGLAAYGESIFGHPGRRESMAGLIVLLAPAFQYALLAPFVLASALASWLGPKPAARE